MRKRTTNLPVNRNKIAPLRGTLADLQSNTDRMIEGEISYAVDTNRHYTLLSGVLVEVGADLANLNTRAVALTVPEGDITNQEQANTFFAGGIEDAHAGVQRNEEQVGLVADKLEEDYYTSAETDEQIAEQIALLEMPENGLENYYTKMETDDAILSALNDQPKNDLSNYYTKQETDERILQGLPDLKPYAEKTWVEAQGYLKAIDIPEGGGDITVDLEGYAKTEYVDEQDAALDERLRVVEVDYTTTEELNAINSRVTSNTREISSLQEGLEAAATKEELLQDHEAWKRADEEIQEAFLANDQQLVERIRAAEAEISDLKQLVAELQTLVAGAYVATQERPVEPAEGTEWMDPQRMQLMVFWRGAWVPSNPCGCSGGDGGPAPGCLPTEGLADVEGDEASEAEWCYQFIPDLPAIAEGKTAKKWKTRKG